MRRTQISKHDEKQNPTKKSIKNFETKAPSNSIPSNGKKQKNREAEQTSEVNEKVGTR